MHSFDRLTVNDRIAKDEETYMLTTLQAKSSKKLQVKFLREKADS